MLLKIVKRALVGLSRDYRVNCHYNDIITGAMASQITSLTTVYSTVYSGADQRKHQSSVSLVFVRGIQHGPVNSPHIGPVTRNMLPIDDVIMREGHKMEWNLQFKASPLPMKDKNLVISRSVDVLPFNKVRPIADILLFAYTSTANMRRWTGSTLVRVMACHLFCANPLHDSVLNYCQ